MSGDLVVTKLVDTILDTCASQIRAPVGGLVTVAMAQTYDNQQAHAAVVRLLSDEPTDVRSARVYPTVTLVETWLPLAKLRSFLADAAAGNARILDFPISSKPERVHRGREQAGTTDPRRETPAFTWDLHWPGAHSSSLQDANSPVLGFGLTPEPTVMTAMNRWLARGLSSASGPSMGNWRFLRIDDRARIAVADWVDDTLTVRVEAGLSLADLELHALWGRHSGPEQTTGERYPMDSEVTTFNPRSGAREVAIHLLHRSGELLATAYANRSRTLPDQTTPSVEDDLLRGESDVVEVKPWTEQGTDKEREILRTIIAFANSGGGRLYLGCYPDGALQPAADLRKFFKADPTEAIVKAKERMEELSRESVAPTPDVQAEIVRFAGGSIVRVTILDGRRTPYHTTDSNEVWVRRGSRSVRPSPDELRQLFRSAQGLSIGGLDDQ